MKRTEGSITVYLLLSGVLVIALICTLTESGRINSVNAMLKGITYMAADSCFSEYAREVFEDYGIMALQKSEAELTASFDGYIDKNLNLSDLGLYRDADLYLMQHDASAIGNVKWLTDDNGQVFAQQVYDYMNYHLAEELVEYLVSDLELFQSGEKIAAFINKINSFKDVFLKVSSTVSKIQKAADQAKSVVYNPKTILGNMCECVERYEQTGSNMYIAQFNTNYLSLNIGTGQLDDCMETIQTESDNYYIYAEQAQQAIAVLQEELDEASDEYTEETLAQIREQLADLQEKTADTEGDYYGIAANCELAKGYQEQLDSLGSLIGEIVPTETVDKIETYKPYVFYYRDEFENFTVDDLGLSETAEPVKQEDSGFIDTIGDIFSSGLLKAVTNGRISDKKTDTSELPSVTVKHSAWGSDGENLLSYSVRKLIFGEYILEHFGYYSEEKEDRALAYEAEYILQGKASDEENLKKTAEDLVLLRSGLNLVSFMTDPAKMSEASLLAAGIIGFTGMWLLVELVKIVIISIWCLAESLCDVKALFAGNKVPVMKQPYEWTVSEIGLTNFTKTILPSAMSDNGLGYRDYLRVLLLTEGQAKQKYRTMDMIQANVCAQYAPDFRMKECISSAELQAQFEARQLFAGFGFVRKVTGAAPGGYSFTVSQGYDY